MPTPLRKRPPCGVAHVLARALWLAVGAAQAATVKFRRVAGGVCAHVGDADARMAAHGGLNANHWPTVPDKRLELGGVQFEFKHRCGAHTSGDTMVWLPQKNLLFAGDMVYINHMLGVIPASNTAQWLVTLAVIEQLKAAMLVPGNASRACLVLERK